MRSRTLLALLLVVPFVDAVFLIYVATRIGGALTVALVVLTAILGMLLLRAEGRAALRRMQTKLARAEPPTNELLDGGLLIAAGALLLTPGLVTDAIGFLFAFPLTRIPIRAALKKYVVLPYLDRETGGFASGNVYIGGFPTGDEFDGFEGTGGTMGGGVGGGPDEFGGGSDGSRDTSDFGATGTQDAASDDIVDVDFTVTEDESSERE